MLPNWPPSWPGSDLPDLLYIYQGGPTPAPSLLQFLQATCADLTPYLAGDAVKDYPNLANFPTYNWQGTGTVYGQNIWGVPIPRSALASSMYVHQEMLESIGASPPTSADDFKRILVALTRPQDNHWGIGSSTSVPFSSRRTAPGDLRRPQQLAARSVGQADQELTRHSSSRRPVGYVRDLFQAGAFDPNSVVGGGARGGPGVDRRADRVRPGAPGWGENGVLPGRSRRGSTRRSRSAGSIRSAPTARASPSFTWGLATSATTVSEQGEPRADQGSDSGC